MNQNSSRAQTNGPDLSRRYYEWNAGKPVVVRIAFDVIDRLERAAVETFRSLTARGSEIGGILLGDISGQGPLSVTVDEIQLVDCDHSRGPLYQLSEPDLQRLGETVQAGVANGAKVVGYFRSHTRKGLGMDESDLALMQSRFKDPGQITLLVRPFAVKASMGGVFIWENGAIHGESSYLEFPFQSSQLTPAGHSAPAPAPKAEQPAAKPVVRARVIPMSSRVDLAPDPVPVAPVPPPAPSPEPAVSAREAAPTVARVEAEESAPVRASGQPEPRREEPATGGSDWEEAPAPAEGWRKLKPTWVWGLVAAAVLACSGVLFVYPGLVRKSSPAPVALSLRIERTAGDLLVTWNRESSAVRDAKAAVLSISDGERQENYQMDVAQLRTGSIVYSPLTPDVSFKLDVTGANQAKIASEMVRVLRTRPSPMESAKASVQPAQAPQSDKALSAAAPAPEEAQQPELAPAPKRAAPRPFNVASLADRLRPATTSDLPLPAPLPQTSDTPASFNIGAITSTELPAVPPARSGEAQGVSQVSQPVLVTSVKPVYPAIAKERRITGAVRVIASIGLDGRVKGIKVLSGNEVLQPAAIAAVKGWVYTPMLLNGKPVEFEKEISLNFVLGAGR
jgi:periplasmic protein TonB